MDGREALTQETAGFELDFTCGQWKREGDGLQILLFSAEMLMLSAHARVMPL